MIHKIKTYGDLLKVLVQMNEAELTQAIQIADPPPNEDEPVECCPCYAIGTVKEYEFYRSRSVNDNKYHADDIVMLIDGNSYGKDGAIAYEGFDLSQPIYSNAGPTSVDDQTCPEGRKSDLTVANKVIIERRVT